MIAASSGLLGLYAVDAQRGWKVFQALWIFHAVLYVFVTAMSFALDPSTARRAWRQGILFPGVISLAIIIYSVAPGPIGLFLTDGLQQVGIEVTDRFVRVVQLFLYAWLAGAMLVAYAAKWMAARWQLDVLPRVLLEIAGYGAFLCSVTFAAYVREIQGARLTWDKTIKTGKVVMPR